jgi:hypothetical protein
MAWPPSCGASRENFLLTAPRFRSLNENIKIFVVIDSVVIGKSMLCMLPKQDFSIA